MTKIITQADLERVKVNAANAPRKRANLNLHDSLDANVQRLFIATEPDTYIRPHRHSESHKWEMFLVLEGEIDLLIFNDDGELTLRTKMSPFDTRVVEIPSNTWHTYVVQKTGTLAIEVKEGGYEPTPEKDFASWSPAENTAQASAFLERLRNLQPE